MSDLNLDFDSGTKNISLSNVLNDNVDFNKDSNNNENNIIDSQNNITPKLQVSDMNGVELLAKGVNNIQTPNDGGYSSGAESNKSEEFSFFKLVEDKGGFVDGDMKTKICKLIGKCHAPPLKEDNTC